MKTKNMIVIALLAAISIILTRFFSIMLPVVGIQGLRISFGDIPIILSGLLFGPFAGALAGSVADLIGAIFLSPYGYFPGFTLSAALVGIIPPLVIRLFGPRKISLFSIFIAIVIMDVITSMGLNTLWLTMMNGKAFILLLPPRIIARLVQIPITTTIVYMLYKTIRNLRLVQ